MKKIIKTLFIIIGFFIAIVLLINTPPFDEKLNPEVVTIMQTKPAAKVDNNAFYAIMGLNASSDKKIIETGQALITRYQNNRKQGNDNLSDEESRQILGTINNIDEPWLEKFGNCNSKTDDDCLLKLSQLLLTQNNDTRLTLMLKRHNEVLNIPYYANFNNITIGAPLPSYRLMLRLGNISIAQLYNNSNKTGFLLFINKEIKFWKMVLEDGEMIIDKMIAQAGIRNNLDYISTYLRNNQPSTEQIELIQSILTPLSNQELDISDSYISESLTIFKAVNDIKPFNFEDMSMLLQKNSYMNLVYKYFSQPNVALSKMSSKDVYRTIKNKSFEKLNQKRDSLISFNPTSLYNYSGKADIKGYCNNCWDYTVRVHDLNNIFNLVKLQLQIGINPTSNVAEYISKSTIRNNYTGESFDYDAQANTLKFQCLDARYTKCKVKL